MTQKFRLKGRILNQYLKIRSRWFTDYVYIHINKTAGSSIEKALGLPSEHITAREKIRQLGLSEWSRRFTFSFVRNPWDKVVSHYNFRTMTNQTGLGENPIPFGNWVKRAYGEQDPKYYDKPQMFQPQLDWITDSEGHIAVNFVGRFECLAADFETVSARLGVRQTLPHHKKSNKRGSNDYRSFYDDVTAQIIGDWFAADIKEFGYTYDDCRG